MVIDHLGRYDHLLKIFGIAKAHCNIFVVFFQMDYVSRRKHFLADISWPFAVDQVSIFF